MNITVENGRVTISGTVRPSDIFIIEDELRGAAKSKDGAQVEVDCSDANILANGMFIDMLRRVEADVKLRGVSKRLGLNVLALVNPPLQLQDAIERMGLYGQFVIVSIGTGEKMQPMQGGHLSQQEMRTMQKMLIGGKLQGGLR